MTQIAAALFEWDAVEARSDLERFFLVRDHLPDSDLIAALEAKRGLGRDDYPVIPMWNAIIAGVVFQHESIELLQRELSRNPSLLQACGFNVLPLQKKPVAQLVKNELTGRMEVVWPQPEAPHYAVPNSWNFSRFLSNLIAVETEQGLVSRMLIDLREQLMAVLPDFGQHLGYDGKAIDSHSTGQVDSQSGHCSDPDADWGHHETAGVNTKTGTPWKKVKNWFGYGLHLIADTHYEIPVAFHLTPASHSEQVELRAMLDELFEQTPELAERCADFSADRGLDCAETKAKLWDESRIRPLIDTRELWRSEKQEPDYDPWPTYYAPSLPRSD
jgi:hypothetical protein